MRVFYSILWMIIGMSVATNTFALATGNTVDDALPIPIPETSDNFPSVSAAKTITNPAINGPVPQVKLPASAAEFSNHRPDIIAPSSESTGTGPATTDMTISRVLQD